jgi:hypothetical protein
MLRYARVQQNSRFDFKIYVEFCVFRDVVSCVEKWVSILLNVLGRKTMVTSKNYFKLLQHYFQCSSCLWSPHGSHHVVLCCYYTTSNPQNVVCQDHTFDPSCQTVFLTHDLSFRALPFFLQITPSTLLGLLTGPTHTTRVVTKTRVDDSNLNLMIFLNPIPVSCYTPHLLPAPTGIRKKHCCLYM